MTLPESGDLVPPKRRSRRGLCLSLLAALGLLWISAAVVLYYVSVTSRRVPHDQQGRESSAISTLKDIQTYQTLFQAQPNSKNRYGTREQLVQEKLLTAKQNKGVRGYTFDTGPGTQSPESQYWATATPTPEWLEASRGDTRSFFTNETGAIWFTTGGSRATIAPDCKPPRGWRVLGR